MREYWVVNDGIVELRLVFDEDLPTYERVRVLANGEWLNALRKVLPFAVL